MPANTWCSSALSRSVSGLSRGSLAQADMGVAVRIGCEVVGPPERVHWLDHAGRGETYKAP